MNVVNIALKNLLPNPFKEDINDGKLDEEKIGKLVEGYEQTLFHENILARPSPKEKGKFELVYGHHRLEAAKRVYGEDHVISLHVVDFSDEQMIVDLCRENLLQGYNYGMERDSVLLTKKHLESQLAVNRVYTKKQWGGNRSEDISARQIALFLSKEGRTISHQKVAEILRIEQNLHPVLKKQLSHKKGPQNDDVLLFTQAREIATLPKDEQIPVAKAVIKSRAERGGRPDEAILKYKKAPEEIKQAIRTGKVDIADVEKVKIVEEKGIRTISYQELAHEFFIKICQLGEEAKLKPHERWAPHCSEQLRSEICTAADELMGELKIIIKKYCGGVEYEKD